MEKEDEEKTGEEDIAGDRGWTGKGKSGKMGLAGEEDMAETGGGLGKVCRGKTGFAGEEGMAGDRG